MKKLKEKMKDRLDAFSDAIIAIIITIMVLDLPITKLANGSVNYIDLFRAIGIYAVSFVFVGNLWYQHAEIFNEVKSVSNLTIITDLILIFFMSLIPTFTKIMTDDTTEFAVTLYAGLCLILMIIYRILVAQVSNFKFDKNSKMQEIYYLFHAKNFNISILSYVILVILSFFLPKVALVLLLVIPIWSFFENIKETDGFEAVTAGVGDKFSEYTKKLTKQQKQDLKLQIASTIKESKNMSKPAKKRLWSEFGKKVIDQGK